jgi:hypothetical protein
LTLPNRRISDGLGYPLIKEIDMSRTTFSGPVASQNGFIGATGVAVTAVLANSASLNFASIAAAASADLTITVTGAAVGDEVAVGLPAAPTAGIIYQAFVSAANTVTVRATNITADAIDPAAQTFNVAVLKLVA